MSMSDVSMNDAVMDYSITLYLDICDIHQQNVGKEVATPWDEFLKCFLFQNAPIQLGI